MTTDRTTMNIDVTDFLNGQNHPLRNEIEQLRACILSVDSRLSENIKWNGPNYCFNGEDRITMKIQPPKSIQLIFHRGAKKRTQPRDRLISDNTSLLVWKENDRAIATFKSVSEIEARKAALTQVISNWLIAAK